VSDARGGVAEGSAARIRRKPMRLLKPLALTSAAASAVAIATAAGGGSPATARVAAKPVTVRLGEYFYRPKRITVHVGQRVRFRNVGKIEHTVADTDARHRIRSRLIHPRPLKHGAVQTVSFRRRGTVRYLCTFHPKLMRGVIRVVRW
jgi:plastocyanin